MHDVQKAPAVIIAGEERTDCRVQYIDMPEKVFNRFLRNLHKLIVFSHFSLFAQHTTAGVIQRRMKNKLEYEPLEIYRE